MMAFAMFSSVTACQLPDDAPVGGPVAPVLGLGDVVFDIAVTRHQLEALSC